MNVFLLKLIAMVTMFIDHFGVVFKSSEIIYRVIGRIAFPIYAFLLVEGFVHTKSVKKYGARLLFLAFISEIPFDLAFYGGVNWTHQNIFFTLFIGLLTLYLLDKNEKDEKHSKFFIVASMGILASLLRLDYEIIGIIYIAVFYLTRNMEKDNRLRIIVPVMFVTNLLVSGLVQQFSLLALVFIYFYNEELGPKNKFIQILFYISYPLHLILYTMLG